MTAIDKESYLQDVLPSALRNLGYLAAGIFLFETILLLIYIISHNIFKAQTGFNAMHWEFWFYPVMYSLQMLVSLFIMLYRRSLSGKINNTSVTENIIFIYLTFLALWAVGITLGDIQIFYNFGSGVYMQMIIVVSVFACSDKPGKYYLLFLGSYIVFVLCLFYARASVQVLYAQLINDFVSVCMAMIIVTMLHKNRRDKFIFVRDLQESKKLLERRELKLQELSVIDEISGLFNRKTLENHINRELVRFARRGDTAVLVFFDIDQLSSILDVKGFSYGDELIKQFSELVKKSCREGDSAVRYSDTEFCVLLPQTDIKGGLSFAEKLRTLIKSTKFVIGLHDEERISITSVVLQLDKCTDSSFNGIMEVLHRSHKLAKSRGQNRIEMVIQEF